jgi:hypothetical protein
MLARIDDLTNLTQVGRLHAPEMNVGGQQPKGIGTL